MLDLLKVFGDPAELAKKLITNATAQFSKPIITDFLNKRMNAASRTVLAEKLEKTAAHLRKGEQGAAADVIADIIDDVKF